MAAQIQRVRDTVDPVVSAAGYDLEDLEISAAGRRSVIRVVVDRDGGVDLDAVAAVSRSVGQALDDELAMGETPYVLEVTSPGVDRPLVAPRHWRRAVGRLVRTEAGGAALTGRVIAVDEQTVTFEVDGGQHGYAFADLAPGAVQIEFNPPRERPQGEDDPA